MPPKPDLGYAWRTTYDAVRTLCRNTDRLPERLIAAWQYDLNLLRVHRIPVEELQARFVDIEKYFLLKGGRYLVEDLSPEEQWRIADEILRLHFAIRDLETD